MSRVDGDSWLIDSSAVAVLTCVMASSFSMLPRFRIGARRISSIPPDRRAGATPATHPFGPRGLACRRLALRERRLAEPLVEPDVAESRLAPGNQRAFTEFSSEIPRMRIGDNIARVVVRGEALTDQF